ncbi:MAG: hypothetical protein H5U17_06730 [Defluviimonas sp.]|nr:hypothetical protein [Defluviimonas sp.]
MGSVAVIALLQAGPTRAQDATFLLPTGVWGDDASWDSGAVPDAAGMGAVIPGGSVADLDGSTFTIGTLGLSALSEVTTGGLVFDNLGSPAAITTTGTGTARITAVDAVLAGDLEFDTDADATLVSGMNISGAGGLSYNGGGDVVVTGASAYSGGTTVTGGTITVQSGTGLGTGGLTLDAATLVAGTDLTVSTMTVTGASTLAAVTGATLDTGAFFVGASPLTFGVASESGTVDLAIFDFTLADRDVTVDSGTLALGDAFSAGTFGEFVADGTLTVAAGATLDAQGFDLVLGSNKDIQGTLVLGDGGSLTTDGLDIAEGATFTVGENVAVILTGNTFDNAGTTSLAAGASLTDNGAVNNLATGTINVNGAGVTIASDADAAGAEAVTNAGALNVTAGDVTVDSGSGSFENSGTIDLAVGTGLMVAAGDTLSNTGTVTTAAASTLTADTVDNLAAGSVTNGGTFAVTTFNNAGTAINDGSLTGDLNNSGGTFTNSATGSVAGTTTISGGTVANSGTLAAVDTQAAGTFDNLAGGSADGVTNAGTGTNAGTVASLDNSGTFGNSGTISGAVSNTGGTLTTSGSIGGTTTISGGTVANSGTLAAVDTQAAGTFDNLAGGSADGVTNAGTGTNAGTVASLTNTDGTFTNSATGAVSGTTTISGGAVTNAGAMASVDNSATFDNLAGGTTGAVTNAGAATNAGTMASVDNSGTLTTSGTVSGTLDNAAGGIVNAQGAINGAVTNAGTFTVTGALAGAGAAFDNIGAGMLSVNAGDYTGLGAVTNSSSAPSALSVGSGYTLGAGSVTNAAGSEAVIDGTVIAAFTNDGTLDSTGGMFSGDFANTGAAFFGSTVTVNGNASNGGSIDMRDGATDDALRVNGGLSGSGSYGLDVDLDGRSADSIIVSGGATSGTPGFDFGLQGSLSSLGSDILFFDVDDAQANSYTIGGVSGLPSSGTVLHSIYQDGANGDLYVRSQVNPAVGGIAANFSLTQLLLGTVINRPQSPFVSGLASGEACSHGGYGRATGGRATVTGSSDNGISDLETSVDAYFSGFQAGYDMGCYDGRYGGWDLAFGGMVGVNQGKTKQDVFAIDPLDPSRYDPSMTVLGQVKTDFDQTYIGAYMAARRDKFTADVQLRFDKTEYVVSSTSGTGLGLDDSEVDSESVTISSRVNYAHDLNEDGLSLVPTAGFAYTHTGDSKLKFSGGEVLKTKSFDALIGFAGGTLAKTTIAESGTAGTTTFMSAVYYNDFAGDRDSTFTDALGGTSDISTSNLGGFGELSVGVNYVSLLDAGRWGGAKQLNANLRVDARFGDDVEDSLGLTAQLRMSF